MGFNNVCIKPGDKWKAAFRTNRGLFEPLMMFVRDVQSGSRVTPEWKGVDNKSGRTTLASARALCLDRLSRV